MKSISPRKSRAIAGLVTAVLTFASHAALAAGTSMPWEQPLQQILDSVQGPVAKIIAVLAIVVTGLAIAFGETSGGLRRMLQIVFGITIAFTAGTFFMTFFSFGGGALLP